MRVTDDFLNAVEEDADWDLMRRLNGKPHKTLKARDLWDQIGHAAWASADPGIQFHTTINDWHTCPKSGPIRASNPCSEYMFLDDTACNLASLNLMTFRSTETGEFDVDRLRARLPAVDGRARDLGADGAIPVAPDRRAQLPLPHARSRLRQHRRAPDGAAASAMTQPRAAPSAAPSRRIMTGVAYATSAEMARELGPFPGYHNNAADMLRVIRNHRRAAYGQKDGYEKLATLPGPLDHRVP